jgi:glucose/arabinose dehydrogenase
MWWMRISARFKIYSTINNMGKLNINMKTTYRNILAIFVISVLLAGCAGTNAGPTPTPPAINTPRPSPTAPDTAETNLEAPAQPAPTETEAVPPTTPAEETPPEPPQPDRVTAFPDPAGYQWTPLLSGLTRPTDLTAPNDGSGRIFILEQAGLIRIARDGQMLPEPFMDIRAQVGDQANEQGLLGLAFHPEYAENGFFFTNYTDTSGTTVISQWQVSDQPDRGDADSEQILMRIQQPFGNHNGGGVKFGPDGFLYLSLGDGGSGGDPQNHGQNTATLLGTLLRIDPDLNGGYTIPEDNPFINGEGQPEIWSYGLRNPWRFTFDDATGDLYIADVGQNAIEEINFVAAGTPGGLNFGWNYKEGTQPFRGTIPAGLELVDPVYEYTHSEGCSVTGGHVVRAEHLPDWNGIYIYGDYCNGRVWGLLQAADGWQSQLMFTTGINISAFGKDEAGNIYLLDHRNGAVLLLEAIEDL